MRRPPKNSFWKTRLRIRAYRQNGGDCGESTTSIGCHSAGWWAFGLWSPIKIYAYGQSSQNIYATTIHELAHASHYNMDKSDFKKTESKVKESWARGVQWELTRMVYPDYRAPEIRPYYTLVIMDMIDDNNRFGNTFATGESVNGYAIRQIEDALKGQRTWNGLRDNIKKRYNNETEENLDALFQYWE